MPINNITQTISELPAAGRRGVDVQTIFVTKQEDFQDHLQGTTVTELNTLKDQLNTRIGEINSTATTMNGYVNDAFAKAGIATTKAGEASTSAGEALTSRNQASTFATNSSNSATKASQWADNAYNVGVETGKYSAKHWSVVAQNATVNKVDKVTSTGNAIVRFNGTTGDVQNSGVVIDDSGNVGIGITPSAWQTNIKTLDLGYGTAVANMASNVSSAFAANCYYNSGWKYKNSSTPASLYEHNGSHTWSIAPSGTAKNPITWTNAMILDASGNLLLTSGTGILGYGTGAGGTVNQLPTLGKATSVVLNKPTGTINTSNSALASGATVEFIVNNSLFSNADIVAILGQDYSSRYRIDAHNGNNNNGLFNIRITNIAAVSYSDVIKISFAIIKGATA